MTRILLSVRTSLIILVLTTLAVTLIPNTAAAQTETKAIEIKFSQVNIPTVHEISGLINPKPEVKIENIATVEVQPSIQDAELKIDSIVEEPAKPVIKKISYELPPKPAPENRVYMSEPEIRAYVCPKIAAQDCNTFIAVLIAENGTHECTRDNRGLNRNGSVDVGLAQINWNPVYHPPYTFEQLQDCKFNLDIAIQKYQTRGFQPWAAYNSGAYKKHLPAVIAAANALAVEAIK